MTSLIQTLAVAEYLNFRHAANALVVSLSSVSARVKTLEEYLGILLVRHGNGGIRHQWLIANRWEARHVKH